MKIIFLCGSLEAGKDGVGDYTRRLAGELIRQGHSCGIIAIMDKYVQESIKEEQQDSEHTNIPVSRLPYTDGYKLNCIEAKEWLDVFNPDWISLQYVPFSFHPKGLPFGFSKSITRLIQGRKLHIMFHELWVAMNKEVSFKFTLWGRVQRAMIRSFIKNVNPLSVHTQTKLYQLQLKKMGVSASLLPLFSNIRRIHSNPKIKHPNHICFIVFGSIHPGAPIEAFVKSLTEYSFENKLEIEITFIGRSGAELQKWIAICQSKKIKIKVLGELSSPKISEALSDSDFGIATTPLLTAEKSGTVTAMLEHGLPVLCVCRSWEVKGFQVDYSPFGIKLFKELDGLTNYLSTSIESVEINSVSNISNQFLDSLLKYK
jgi:hypothetical protein